MPFFIPYKELRLRMTPYSLCYNERNSRPLRAAQTIQIFFCPGPLSFLSPYWSKVVETGDESGKSVHLEFTSFGLLWSRATLRKNVREWEWSFAPRGYLYSLFFLSGKRVINAFVLSRQTAIGKKSTLARRTNPWWAVNIVISGTKGKKRPILSIVRLQLSDSLFPGASPSKKGSPANLCRSSVSVSTSALALIRSETIL